VNILYLDSLGAVGGAERALLDLLAGLKTAHPDWHLALVSGSDGALVDEARALGVAASVLELPPAIAMLGDAGAGGPAGMQTGWLALSGRMIAALPAAAVYVRRLRRAIADAEPDLIHSNSLKMHVLAGRAAPRGLPMLWHLHDYVSARPLMSRVLPFYARGCTSMIANSRSVADDARRVFPSARVCTVYNAVDLRRFVPRGPALNLDALAGMPPLPEGGIRVGLVATMSRWKGHMTFLSALTALTPGPVRAYVIGGPLYQTAGSQYGLDELRSTAARMGLAERVGFTGFVADTAAAMRALDIVVHASTAPEPFGLVVAEAMACGRAVIVSAAGGAAELIDDGVTAMAHQPGDSAALSALIARLAGDRELRIRLGNNARAAAERMFTRERMAAEVASIYEQRGAAGA